MRPWLHIPVLIFLGALLLGGWVAFRPIELERQDPAPMLDGPLAKLPPPQPRGILEGVLVDPLGEPVAEADLSTQQDGRILWTQTRADGSFALQGLQGGPLQLSVLPRGRLPEVFSLVGPGKQVRLALQRPEETVPTIPTLTHSDWWGRVRNPVDRKHLAGYQIWLIPTGAADSLQAGIPRRTETDADGDFWIPSLIHTDYQVYVLAPGDGGSLEPNLLVPLGASPPLLDHGSGATPAEWVLQSGQLFGEVRSEGRPVRSAMVMLEALVDSNAETGLSRVLPAVQTDAEGRWLVPDLPPATYRVRVRGGGIAQEKQIEVRANQRLRVQF